MYTDLAEANIGSQMKISVKSEYALAAVLHLALSPPAEFIKVGVIAESHAIPLRFLELIFSELKLRGFVAARRGANGGYRLARPADQITVGQILDSLGERRPRKQRDGLSDLLARLNTSVWAVLDRTTFAEVIAEKQVTSRNCATSPSVSMVSSAETGYDGRLRLPG